MARKSPLSDEENRHAGWKDPEIQAKAAETRRINKEAKKARQQAATDGFGMSKLADPNSQARLIDKLYAMAVSSESELSDVKWAMKMLNEMGVIKQPAEKPAEPEKEVPVEIEPEDAISILKAASKKDEEE